jgi:hypothetical protein
MPNRGTLLAAVLVCAVVIPYLQDSSGGGLDPVRAWWSSFFVDSDEGHSSHPAVRAEQPTYPVYTTTNQGAPGSKPWMAPRGSMERSSPGPQFQSLAQILRFDVSPEWVTNTWPLVSTSVREDQLSGMRLPLVSGIREQDIAGSLTYWFNPQRQCDRIDLSGSTGDPGELIALVTQGYGLKVEPAPGGMLLLGRDPSNHPRSVLRVRPGKLVRQDQPHLRYAIELELQRPGSQMALSRGLRERMHLEGIRAEGLGIDAKPTSTAPDRSGNPPAASLQPLEKDLTVSPSPAPNGPPSPPRRRPATEFLLPHSR